MPAPITRSLGRFVAELRYEALPKAALDVVRTGFTDCVAVMLAGIDEKVARIVREQLGTRGKNGEASLYLGSERASAPEAALANAEAVGASGAEAVAAYVAGYEVWAHLIERDKDAYHRKGWHPTAVLGP